MCDGPEMDRSLVEIATNACLLSIYQTRKHVGVFSLELIRETCAYKCTRGGFEHIKRYRLVEEAQQKY